ncbi:hypothetical protein, partial [Burkholderia ubonensis]|uniref:hypothetical protein n=1 Tax=Burkholderia ubonensis TaxID=101571 RepID=UPI001E4AC5E2
RDVVLAKPQLNGKLGWQWNMQIVYVINLRTQDCPGRNIKFNLSLHRTEVYFRHHSPQSTAGGLDQQFFL